MPEKELKTDRLILKSITPEDRDFIFALFSSDEVNRYLFDAKLPKYIKG